MTVTAFRARRRVHGSCGRARRAAITVAAAVSLTAAAAATATTATTPPATAAATATATTTPAGWPHAATAAPGTPAPSWLPTTPPYWPLVTGEQIGRHEQLTRGVVHWTDGFDTVGGRQRAQVLGVDLTDPNVRAGVVEAGDHVIDESDESLSSMGTRSGAVAGVNGDFFAIQNQGDPSGMLVQDGRLSKSPNPGGHRSDFLLLDDGRAVVASESFSGTVTDGSATYPLAAVNTVDPPLADSVTLVTADEGPVTIPASTVATGHLVDGGVRLAIDSLQDGVTELPQLRDGEQALVGAGAGDDWLSASVHAGDVVSVSDSLSPYPLSQIRTALSGGAILVADGAMAVPVQGTGENNQADPVTGVGVSPDGRHLIAAVFDGHQPESRAEGLTRPQMAQWMIEHGARNAILFDTGGSSEMVGRLPGQTAPSVLTTPSDGHERPLANGLFFFSTEDRPGVPARVAVDGGRPLELLAGTSAPVTSHAFDARGNPAAQTPSLSVADPGVATVTGGDTVTAGPAAGATTLTATAGDASASVPLRVVSRLAKLTISPARPDLDDGETQQLSVTAVAAGGSRVELPATDVSWSASPTALGTVSSAGTFTAAAGGEGLVTVTARAGGASATTTVAVGHDARVVDPLTDPTQWTVTASGGATGTLSHSDRSPGPFASGSLQLDFTFPAGLGYKQFYLRPTAPATIDAVDGRTPDEIGIWIEGDGQDPTPHTPLTHGNLTFGESVTQGNGQALTFWPTTTTYDGWRLVVAKLPAGTQFPLTVSFLDFIDELPPSDRSGTVRFTQLQALYSSRPAPPVPAWRPVAGNPPWLSFTRDPASLRSGGRTFAAVSGAQIAAGSAPSPGAAALARVDRDGGGDGAGRPSSIQTLGDMSASGSVADLGAARSALAALRTPFATAVGERETSDGADPEDGNYASVFGATHTATRLGAAEMLVLDDAAGGLLAADPHQSPAEEQYEWLAAQLDRDTAPVTFVSMSLPLSDPYGGRGDQFADDYEAGQLATLLDRYRRTHPGRHVVVLAGQRSGYSEQRLGPGAAPNAEGTPVFDVSDLASPPTAAPDRGGFLDAGLFHVGSDGRVAYAIEPLLSAIAIAAPSRQLAPGRGEVLTATGTELAGAGADAGTVPIADPLARRWSSSRPSVVTVDPDHGRVLALRPGTATISASSGGVRSQVTITVPRRP